MKILFKEELTEAANVGITSLSAILLQLFEKYEQMTSFEDAVAVSRGPTIFPIVGYEAVRFHLKSNAIRNTNCEARFIVYSKKEKSILKKDEVNLPCPRFIHEHRTDDLEVILKKMPVPIREGHFDQDGENTVAHLLSLLASVEADRIKFMYSPVTCEGVVTHCIAVVHEYGPEGDPTVVATSYFSISVGK